MSGELQDWLSDLESWSTIIRNFGLVIAAGIALWFAKQRIVVSDRQAETAQRGLLNERYQKGAEMLGSEVLAVRLGGIYALAGLAREDPEDYHTKIMRLLCGFVVDADLNHANLPNADLTVLPPSSVGEMTLRLYGALSYSQNSARDLRCALNGA